MISMTTLPASCARVGQAFARAAWSSDGYPPSRSAGLNTAAPRWAAIAASSCAGPRPVRLLNPAFSSILSNSGPVPGCAPSHSRMSSRQNSRFLLVPPEYSCAGVLAATQLSALPNGLLWLTFHSRVKTSSHTSSSIRPGCSSSACARKANAAGSYVLCRPTVVVCEIRLSGPGAAHAGVADTARKAANAAATRVLRMEP